MITELAAKNAKPKEKSYLIHDDRGLYLRVDPSGKKYWILRTWKDGKEKKTSLGPYPAIGLKDARIKRDAIYAARLRGEDPFLKAPGRAENFQEVSEDWLKVKMATKALSYLETIHARLQKYILPEFGNVKLADITSGQILRLCRGIEASGTIETARRVKVIIGQVFNFAIATDRAETNPTDALAGALASRAKRHHPGPTRREDIKTLVRAVKNYPYLVVRCGLLFSILIFCRPGEVRAAEWKEIDFDRFEWKIPAEKMKMRRPHIVPLSNQALKILSELKEFTGSGRYLFPSARNDGRCMSENTLRVALRSLGFSNDQITPHGFRSMASTVLNENGFNPDVIERQLAHVEKNAVRAAYNHAQYLDERIKMMEWWSNFIFECGQNL